MDVLGSILTAFGLSASAGLNAYIPLLIVAVIGRFTDWITLASPWDALESWWVIGALVLLTMIEFFADKVPAVNHVNDVLQTFVRPAAGAVLFAASTRVVTGIHPIVALIAGLVVAGSVHTVKAAAVRPAVTATTGGAGNVVVSLAEDLAATVLSILAVVVPVVIAAILIVAVSLFIWWLWRRSNATSMA
jgi:hypothetical protein